MPSRPHRLWSLPLAPVRLQLRVGLGVGRSTESVRKLSGDPGCSFEEDWVAEVLEDVEVGLVGDL